MSEVTALLDQLATGKITLSEAKAQMRTIDWVKPGTAGITDVDGVAPVENSFDEVQVDSRLTTRQYSQLAEAYRQAVGGQDG